MKILRLVYLCLFIPTLIFSESFYQIIKKQKKIIIGISKEYPPLNFSENNARSGIEMDMIESLAEYLSAVPELVPLNVDEYTSAIETGKVNLVIAGMSRSLERSKKIWFSIPYLKISPAVLVDSRILRKTTFGDDIEEKPVTSLWELKNYSQIVFAVKKGSVYEEFIHENFPGANIKIYQQNNEAFEMLFSYEVNVLLHDSLYLEYYLQKNPQVNKSFTFLKASGHEEYICIGIPSGDYFLKNQIDLWIDEAVRTGRMKKWRSKYISDED